MPVDHDARAPQRHQPPLPFQYATAGTHDVADPVRDLAVRERDDVAAGPFDVVVSALAVHHLDRAGKADLFRRVAGVLAPGGRFVLGDVIEPVDPADVVTPIDGVFDQPSPIADQLRWLADAGFDAEAVWVERDLAVLVAGRAPSLAS